MLLKSHDVRYRMPMNRAELIAQRMQKFNPEVCEVTDESHGHSRGTETHYKILLVSSAFEGKSRVERQRMVYAELKDLFDQGLHAVTQLTFSPVEWAKTDKSALISSPSCRSRSNG